VAKEKGDEMLTRRGVIVKNVAIVLAVIFVMIIAERITTPPACKVDSQSQTCLDMLYP
jgi:hypothetical protein